MKCDKCAKKATVHLTEIIDGKAAEMHLCEDCAREQSQHMEQQFGLADLLAGLTDFGKQLPEVQNDVLTCPNCGLSYEDFRKFGRFGCSQCYVAFKAHLKTLLKKIHGSNIHLGKKLSALEQAVEAAPAPEAESVQQEVSAEATPKTKEEIVEDLRRQMYAAIEKEDFEQAAAIRDKIYELEKKGSHGA